LVRTGMMVAVVFVAESLPTFGPLLDLVGGSTLTLTSVVFPCLFYIYLAAARKDAEGNWTVPKLSEVLSRTPKHQLIVCIAIMIFGLIGGGAATYSAIKELSTTQFTTPCYVAPFINDTHPNDADSAHTNCCGHFQNISRYNDPSQCTTPKLDFYTG